MKNSKFWLKNILATDSIYKFNLKNSYEIPNLDKITLHIDLNHNTSTPKRIIIALKTLILLTNQKPNIYRSTKNISGSKLRKGSIVNCNVIINKKNIFDFLNFFIFFILPQKKNAKFVYKNEKKNYLLELNSFLLISSIFNKDLNFNNNNINIKLTIETNLKDLKHSKIFLSGLQIPIK